MKINQVIKGVFGVCALAGMAVLTGCSCSPVGEMVHEQTYQAVPVSQIRTTQTSTFEPVAERCSIPVETTSNFCN